MPPATRPNEYVGLDRVPASRQLLGAWQGEHFRLKDRHRAGGCSDDQIDALLAAAILDNQLAADSAISRDLDAQHIRDRACVGVDQGSEQVRPRVLVVDRNEVPQIRNGVHAHRLCFVSFTCCAPGWRIRPIPPAGFGGQELPRSFQPYTAPLANHT